MARNAILEELHAARRKILADCKGDTAAYLRDAQARLEASGRPVVDWKQRTIRRAAALESNDSGKAKRTLPPRAR